MIQRDEFFQRQQRLLAQCADSAICLIPAARLQIRSRDTHYRFRQHSDFWYLLGFDEPDAWLVLSNHPRYGDEWSYLLCRDKQPEEERWHGRRLGPVAAVNTLAVKQAAALENLSQQLYDLLQGHQHVYCALGEDSLNDQTLLSVLQRLRSVPKSQLAPPSIQDIRPLLHQQRLFKSPAELAIMRQAAQLSAKAHCRAMRFATPGCFEYQLEAEIRHEFTRHGARSAAYESIVGSGINACILHYTDNRRRCQDGELVLIDAGAELYGYAADITRTFPVNGRFSSAQRDLYQLVLASQQAALAFIGPGRLLSDAYDRCVEVLTDGLLHLGILRGSLAQHLEQKSYRTYFMHGLGHYLGLDVHDVGEYKRDNREVPLAENMVITVEPGLYIDEDADVPEAFRGMGIRIEDNVHIMSSGIEIMTHDAPNTIEGIEALMQDAASYD